MKNPIALLISVPFSAVSLGVVQQTAGEHHALAALGKLTLDLEAEALCLVLDDDLAAVFNDAADICDNEIVALIYPFTNSSGRMPLLMRF